MLSEVWLLNFLRIWILCNVPNRTGCNHCGKNLRPSQLQIAFEQSSITLLLVYSPKRHGFLGKWSFTVKNGRSRFFHVYSRFSHDSSHNYCLKMTSRSDTYKFVRPHFKLLILFVWILLVPDSAIRVRKNERSLNANPSHYI
jgi:hypothetical protein